MSLRGALLILGMGLVVAAGACLLYGLVGVSIWLAFNGVLLAAGMAYERWRYKAPCAQPPQGKWQRTGERFIDPESGRMVEVYYDSASGDRSYVDLGNS